MPTHFDHLTIVVRDIDRAKAFFALLGFKEAISVVIAGEPFAGYMGVSGIEAEHVTLVLEHTCRRERKSSSCATGIPIPCSIRTSATCTGSA